MPRHFQTGSLCLAACALLQAAPSLDEILGKMDADAPKFNGMIADVSRVTYTKVLDEKTAEAGTIKLRKLGRDLQVRIDFTKPDPKIVAFRGRKAEMFFPKLNTVQEYDLGKQRSLVDQFLLVGFGTTGGDLKSNYSLKLGGEETVAGQKTFRLELTPLNASVKEKLSRLQLWMSESGEYPVQQQFLQPSGDYYLVTFTNTKLNPSLSEDDLKLRLPKNVKRETKR